MPSPISLPACMYPTSVGNTIPSAEREMLTRYVLPGTRVGGLKISLVSLSVKLCSREQTSSVEDLEREKSAEVVHGDH